MRYYMLQVALALGVDPFTFAILGLVASICAFCMKEMMPNPWMAFAFYPVLLAAGLLTVTLATLIGIVGPIEVRIDSDGDFHADWAAVMEILPVVVLTGLAGMCGAAVGIIQIVRSMARYV